MKILHILDHSIPLHSGYSFRTKAILEQQNKLGWDTVHLTSTKHYGADVLEETVDGFKFYRTPDESTVLSKIPVLNQYAVVKDLKKRLLELVEKEKPDILHAHSPCLNGLAAMSVAKQKKLPLVYEMRASWEDAAVNHGTTTEGSLRYRFSRALETHVLKNVNAITTICEGLKKDISSRGIDRADITVVPNSINLEKFSRLTEKNQVLLKKLNLENCHVLGFLGSFYGYEGIDLIIRALPKIVESNPDVKVLLVGGGLQEDALKQLAVDLNVVDSVIFTGRVSHDEVSAYYSLVDILVYPRLSIRLTETVTPLKPLEAMAQGRLVVASDIGGHREMIEHGRTGYLFPAEDADALSALIVKLLANRSEWGTVIDAGYDYVRNERNWMQSVKNYMPVYEKLLPNSRSQAVI